MTEFSFKNIGITPEIAIGRFKFSRIQPVYATPEIQKLVEDDVRNQFKINKESREKLNCALSQIDDTSSHPLIKMMIGVDQDGNVSKTYHNPLTNLSMSVSQKEFNCIIGSGTFMTIKFEPQSIHLQLISSFTDMNSHLSECLLVDPYIGLSVDVVEQFIIESLNKFHRLIYDMKESASCILQDTSMAMNSIQKLIKK